MSSRNCFNISRVLVIVLAILDLVLCVYSLLSAFISRRQGTYNHYETEWNVFYASRIVTTIVVLFGVIREKALWMVLGGVLNGLILAVLIYFVSLAKFSYVKCERDLCRLSGGSSCLVCDTRNYNDYDFTSKWTRELTDVCALSCE